MEEALRSDLSPCHHDAMQEMVYSRKLLNWALAAKAVDSVQNFAVETCVSGYLGTTIRKQKT